MCGESYQGIVVFECCNASCVLFACFEEAVEFFGVYVNVVCVNLDVYLVSACLISLCSVFCMFL